MHKHKRHRHGHHGWHFGGWFWIIGLWFLFTNGHGIWPGILVLIGLSMVFGSFFREERRSADPQNPPTFQPWEPVTSPLAPRPVPAPVEQTHPVDLLPATCQQCGGPVRSYEVKWKGRQTAACTYCGSNLKMKKAN